MKHKSRNSLALGIHATQKKGAADDVFSLRSENDGALGGTYGARRLWCNGLL
jgi:hypothetical protein